MPIYLFISKREREDKRLSYKGAQNREGSTDISEGLVCRGPT